MKGCVIAVKSNTHCQITPVLLLKLGSVKSMQTVMNLKSFIVVVFFGWGGYITFGHLNPGLTLDEPH